MQAILEEQKGGEVMFERGCETIRYFIKGKVGRERVILHALVGSWCLA